MQVADTGNARVDAMGDVLNAALAPFHEAPDPEKGALGVVEQGIGAVMGVQNAPLELLNTGFAMVTAPVAAMMPAFPAAYLTVPHLGTPHAHAHPPSLVPPAPPVPLPSIGTLMLPGCVSVLIGGMPAGRAGDLGLAPTCGSLAPAFDVFLGSSNTFIGGNRAARMTDMTRHCNPASKALIVSRGAALMGAAIGAVGAGASAAAGQALAAAMQAAQLAADAAAAALSALLGTDPGIPPAMGALMLGHPTVLIGGFPCPNFPNPLDGLMKGLKKLGKALANSKGLGKLLKKVGLCNAPGEPIDPFSGEVFNDFEDYRAADTGFVWARHYRSGWNELNGPLGFGYRHFYQRKLTLLRKRAIYETHDNEVVAIERLDDGRFRPGDGFRLRGDGRRFELTTDRDETLEFEALSTTPVTARLTRYQAGTLDVFLFYDERGRLRAFSEYEGGQATDTHLAYGEHGLVEQVLRGQRGQPLHPVARYAYHEGCLVEWRDAVGGSARFRYDVVRRMVQGTDRRGYSFHWHYDPSTGRCIKSYGDDGLWGVEARYEGAQSFFTEPDGGTWGFRFHPDGTVSHVVDPCGGVTQYVAGEGGRITKQVTPSGRVFHFQYDKNGKHTGRVGPFRTVVPPEEEAPNPPSGLGHRGPGKPSEWLWGRGHARAVAPLPKLPGAVAEQLAVPREPPPELTRDAAGRVVRRTYASSEVEYMQRDAEGNLVAQSDTKGNWWQKHIVSWNLVGAERSPLGSVTQYAYTHRQKRSLIVDANGNRAEYLRDRAQRVTEIVQNGRSYLRYRRGVDGAILEESDGDGVWLVRHQTNRLGLHTQTELQSGERYTYAYDRLGNFTEASSSRHQVKRGFLSRRLIEELRDGRGIAHRFDDDGVTESVVFGRFRVTYVNAPGGVRVVTPDGGEHHFWRDAEGVYCRQNQNGTGEALAFDAQDRLVSRACFRSSADGVATTWVSRYRYDAEGLLCEVLDSELGRASFEYDADQRLVSQRGPGALRFDYAYDLANNLSLTPAHGRVLALPDNLLAHSNRERFEFDSRQRLAKRVGADGVETHYTYDSHDQLVEAAFSDRAEVWRAAYDGLGRRLWREYAGRRTDFYWDGDRLAAEVAPDGALRVYVYPNEDALVPFLFLDYASADADPASGVAHYLFTAPTGMPLRVEDGAGQVLWQGGTFEPYGASAPGSPLPPTRLRFAGHFYDEHLGLFYNRFRDYDPALGRYLQPDPLGHAGGLNLYAYPANPAVAVDLRGLVHQAKRPAEGGGEQGGDKRPSREAEPPKTDGADSAASRKTRDRELAAAPNAGPDGKPTLGQVNARKRVAAEHVRTHGQKYDRSSGKLVPLTKKDRKDQLKGIDYGQPVVSGPPPEMPEKLTQWQVPGNSRGSYFAPAGTTPGELGIGDDGRAWTKPGAPVEKKQVKTYTIQDPETQTYLKSTAAPIDDDWSVPAHGGSPGRVQPTPGGGTQYCVYEGADPNYSGIS